MRRINLIGLACLMSASVVGVALTARADEWEESSPYYEDDAWYDITEWMDGNDYNPVDEQYGKWDDEVYDSDAPSMDRDNDRTYGYAANNDNDWFYDYWDPNYSYYGYTPHYDSTGSADTRQTASNSDDTFDRVFYYLDRNNDGRYDSYVAYYDYDDDGDYDSVVSYDFRTGKSSQQASKDGKAGQSKDQAQASKSKDQKASNQASAPSSKRHQLTGKIINKKMVDVRGTKHVIVQLQNQQGDQKVAVDLGRQEAVKDLKIEKDQQITVSGPMTQAGDKKVVLAQRVTIDGKQHQIDRNARKFTGTVVDTREAKVRGQNHRLVVLKLQNGKQRLIDLGRSDRLKNMEIKKDAQLTVRGVPFAMQDRPVVLAQSIEKDGKSVQIDRRPDQSAARTATKS